MGTGDVVLTSRNEAVGGGRGDGYRLLSQPVEKHPPMLRAPPIDPAGELVEGEPQLLVGPPALMDAQEPAFQQSDDAVNPGTEGNGPYPPGHCQH